MKPIPLQFCTDKFPSARVSISRPGAPRPDGRLPIPIISSTRRNDLCGQLDLNLFESIKRYRVFRYAMPKLRANFRSGLLAIARQVAALAANAYVYS